MDKVIKTYKGFSEDMTCRWFQYEEGKEYEESRADACNCGFHACEYPLDCLGYYDPAHSVYHEVEQSGELSRKDDGDSSATGYRGASEAAHPNGIAVAWGPESKAKGVKGATLVFAEWERIDPYCSYWREKAWGFVGSMMVQVDGENIKENTWYTMKNGEIVEAEYE